MTAFETDLLARLVEAKYACLAQLRDMGRRQLELIDEGNMTALLDLLAAKQRSIIKLQKIERGLDAFREQQPDERQWKTPEQRRRCAEQLQQCETLLGEIVSQEKCSEGAMIRRRDETADRLQGVHRAGQARGAYTTTPAATISQLDLSSEK